VPICQKCSARFPNRHVVNGVKKNLQNRKYCLSCSPFGRRNTRKLERGLPLKGDLLTCTRCNREYSYDKRQGHLLNHCNSCVKNLQKQEIKEKCIVYKGSKCIVCGYDRCTRALQFHHLDPEIKLFAIGGNLLRKWSDVQAELDKCVLICGNCHAELHAGLIQLEDFAQLA
jgi:hypothetical protein